jgi:mRNA interferase HigB
MMPPDTTQSRRMKVVGRPLLQSFCEKYRHAKNWIENWLADVEATSWESSHDIKQQYRSASFLPGNVVIFNVKGNEFRLEVQVAYRTSVVVVKWIGTHAEYDRRNAKR